MGCICVSADSLQPVCERYALPGAGEVKIPETKALSLPRLQRQRIHPRGDGVSQLLMRSFRSVLQCLEVAR